MGRVLVRDEEKVPEKGSGDDYTTLCMYLMALNCTLEVVNMVNLMLYIFYHNQKIFFKKLLIDKWWY